MAIAYCLCEAKVSLADVDHLARGRLVNRGRGAALLLDVTYCDRPIRVWRNTPDRGRPISNHLAAVAQVSTCSLSCVNSIAA
jgi:hypothetical protein